MVEEALQPIDEFVKYVGLADEMLIREELLQKVSGAIGVKKNSLVTNYLTKRSFSEYKVKGANIISKTYLESKEAKELSKQRKQNNETKSNVSTNTREQVALSNMEAKYRVGALNNIDEFALFIETLKTEV